MNSLKTYTGYIELNTQGDIDIIDITPQIEQKLKESKIYDGILNLFVSGATGAVATVEYEQELIKDTKNLFRELVKEEKTYYHNKTHAKGNAVSHLRATLIGPSLTIPITEGKLNLGIWQQVVFIDFDNRPRNRKLVVKIIGITDKQK
ncbi:MAG: secondary thiamine-phosphate synthase enzyme YjbQ [Endomicrobia bacterium]|nr:secondary thiamine-phosphate synthase enzyme YjbQ [Endomicrobiia bacterium]